MSVCAADSIPYPLALLAVEAAAAVGSGQDLAWQAYRVSWSVLQRAYAVIVLQVVMRLQLVQT